LNGRCRRLGLAVPVEQVHQQQFLPRMQVHLAQHGGGAAAVGAGELEDRVAQRSLAGHGRDARLGFGHGSVPLTVLAEWSVEPTAPPA
jgi:hypothetical protein